MFELSVARKYLTPKWRQLSVSIISTVSILVIALVVWLIIVFFSVTEGLEKTWIQKLIALTAPIRITPTDAYTHSYYYQIDSLSLATNYTLKSIAEKLEAPASDPYNPDLDEEIPAHFPLPDKETDGSLKDIVKKAYQAISSVESHPLKVRDFEMTVSNLRLHLARHASAGANNQFLSQVTYLGSFDPKNSLFLKTLLPISMADLKNALEMSLMDSGNVQEDSPAGYRPVDQNSAQQTLNNLFNGISIHQLKTPAQGWLIPQRFLSSIKTRTLRGCLVEGKNRILRVVVPQTTENLSSLQKSLINEGYQVKLATLWFDGDQKTYTQDGSDKHEPLHAPLFMEGETFFPTTLVKSSIETALFLQDVRFRIAFHLQGNELEGEVPLGSLAIATADMKEHFNQKPAFQPPWLYTVTDSDNSMEITLPADPLAGEGILVPKSFRDAGALLGDRGILSYYAPTASSMQEQRLPVYIAGFYDPGIIPIGGKYVLANHEIVSQIRALQSQEGSNSSQTNGINVRFDALPQVDKIKAEIQEAFKREGIDRYWKVETYREFEFTKDLIQQLRSEKNLWSLIATIIIIVACSNIISMLIILVNDKKTEIGILRSMGASSKSIALIFGICGVIMGLLGSLLGTFAAVITLKNLRSLLDLISRLQGYDVFNPVFYGNNLPNEISVNALMFVIIATSVISLIAGIIPAVKASMIRPSAILKSE